MPKYRVEISGLTASCVVEADNPEAAEEKALSASDGDWEVNWMSGDDPEVEEATDG